MEKRILIFGVALVVSQAVWAGETVWTGAADAFWTNALNWTAGVPVAVDTARFDATGANGATTIDLAGAGLIQKLVVTGEGCPKYVFGTSSAQTLRLSAVGRSEVDDLSYGIFVDASVPSANVPALVATLGGECRVATYCYQRIENNSSGTFVMNDFGDYTADETINESGKTTYPEPCFFGTGPIEIRGVCVNSTWPERKCKIVTELGLRGTGNVKVCKSFSVNRLFGEGAGAIVRSLEIPEGVMLSFTGPGFQWIGRAQMHIYGGGTLGFYAGTGATFENSLGNANYTHVVDVAVSNLYGTAKAVGIRYYGAGVHYYNHPDNDLGGPLQLYSSSDSIFLTIAAHKFGKKGEPSCVGRAVSSFQCERNAAIRYIGTEPDETDRDIVFGTKSGWEPWNSKARIDQCGSGTFTYSGTFTSQDGARSADLVLAGTGTADGILTSTLADQPNYALTLTKQESCRWVLTGASAHTGATTVEAGTLALGAGGSIENSPVVLKGGTFAVLSGVATTVGRVEIAGGDQLLDIAAGATLTVAGGIVRSIGRLNVTLGAGGTIVCPALAGTSPNWMSANGQAVRFAADGTMAVDPAPVYAYSVGETVTNGETFVFHDGATLSVTGLDRLLPDDSLCVLAEFPRGYTGTPQLSEGTVLPEGWELVLTSTQFLLCNTSKEYRLDLAAVDAPGGRINFFVPVAMSLAHCEGFEFDFYNSNSSYAGSWTVATYVRGGSVNNTYNIRVKPENAEGWSHVVVRKVSLYNTEHEPRGWNGVEQFKLTMTRPSAEAATFIVRNVRPLAGPAAPAVALLFHENGHERSSVGVIPAADFSRNQNLSIGLSDLGLANYLLSDADLEQGPIPEATRLLVYEDGGYDEVGGQPPEAVIEHLTEFVARGGGVIFTGVGKESTALRTFVSAHPDRTVSVSISAYQSLVGPNREAIRSSVLRLMPSAADIMATADERRAAEQAAADAWTAAQPSRQDDVRSIYCNNPTLGDCGGAVSDWMTLAKLLKKAGMTRVDVDICRGMYSAYPSSVLVRQPGLENRDCLAECLAACRRWGLELYAWRCCWTTPEWICTDEMAQRLRNEGRCAINNLGVEETHGGCPTHPDNISVEVESMVELAKSGVDGINFDFIRYNGNNVCFCARCRAKFEEFLGQPVENWPADAYVGGKYFDNKWKEFRCGNISHVVEEIARRVRAEAPGVRISVSGFQTEDAPQSVGQDWAYWCRQGWIDEVDIMAYYDSADQFGTIVGNLMKRDVGSATLRPLIGLNSWDRTGTESKRLTEQILKAREIGCSGWGVYAVDDRFIRMLPYLAQGPLSTPSGRPVPKLGPIILFK